MVTNRQVALGFLAIFGSSVLGACSDAATRNLTAPSAGTLAAVTGQSASTFTTSEVVPFDAVFTGAEVCEEDIAVSGRLHILMHGTISSSGNVHGKIHFQPQNVKGVGVTSGTQYVAPGVFQDVFSINGPLPYTDTFVNNVHLIGRGTAIDLHLHATAHTTINANGEITSVVDNFSLECK